MMDAAAYRAHIEPLLAQHFPEVFIVEFMLTKGGTLRLLVETDSGVTVDTCSKINRAIRHYFFEQEIDTDKLAIEVSSPGVGAALRLPRQYNSNTGRQLKVTLQDGQSLSGTLRQVLPEGIILEVKKTKAKAKACAALALAATENTENTTPTAPAPAAPLPEGFVPFGQIRESRVVLPF